MRAHPDLAEAPGLQGDEFVVRLVQAGQHHARVADHGLAVPGGLHAARQALEQRHLQHVLQVLQQLGGGRLRHVEHLGRAVDVALLGQRDQQQQLPRLEAGADEPVAVVRHGGVFLNAWFDIDSAEISIGAMPLLILDSLHDTERFALKPSDLKQNARQYINGRWETGVTTGISENPSDTARGGGRVRARRPQPGRARHPRRRRCLRAWSHSTPQRRADALDQIGSELLARKDELGMLLAREEGKTLPEAVAEAARAGQIFKFFAGEALRIAGETWPRPRPGVQVDVTREPVGVVGADHALELSVRHPGLEDRAGPGLRQQRGVQAGRTRCRPAAGRWPRSSAAQPCRRAPSTW